MVSKYVLYERKVKKNSYLINLTAKGETPKKRTLSLQDTGPYFSLKLKFYNQGLPK